MTPTEATQLRAEKSLPPSWPTWRPSGSPPAVSARPGRSVAPVPVQGPRLNPRWLAYCRAQGHDPDEQLAIDRARFPGGSMTGFILWIDAAWREWDRLNGHREPWPQHSLDDHAAFDAWLTAREMAG